MILSPELSGVKMELIAGFISGMELLMLKPGLRRLAVGGMIATDL